MIRKGIITFICFSLLLITSFTHNDRLTAANQQIVIKAETMNVRSGAGLTFPVIASVSTGQSFDVIEKKNNWIKIKLSAHTTGWVAGWLVTEKKSDPSVSTKYSKVVSKATNLRIRSGPGTTFSIIGVFEHGASATFLEKSGEWLKISLANKQGWIHSQYVELQTDTESPSNSYSTDKDRAVVTATILNIRETPSIQGKQIGALKKNAIVKVIKVQGSWAQIETNSFKGWVHMEHLTFNSSALENQKDTVGPSTFGTITASSLNVRNSGSLNGHVIGSVSKGERVTILEEKNDWYKIGFQGKTGWVAGWYITKTVNIPDAANQQEKKLVKILYNGTNIRSGASTNDPVVKRASQGELFEIISAEGDWYKIRVGSNQIGFIAGWVVEATGLHSNITRPGIEQYLKNKIIVIDPGHGGQDSGAVGASGTLEKNLTLLTAKLVYNKLKSAGANVFLTRSNDLYISLNSRVSTSHYRNAEAFVSLHYDSAVDKSASGTTAYYYHSIKDKPLASKINSELVKQVKLKDRETRQGNFYVLRENRAPAVLIELGFLSNRTEELTVTTSSFQELASQGIFNGLALYFK